MVYQRFLFWRRFSGDGIHKLLQQLNLNKAWGPKSLRIGIQIECVDQMHPLVKRCWPKVYKLKVCKLTLYQLIGRIHLSHHWSRNEVDLYHQTTVHFFPFQDFLEAVFKVASYINFPDFVWYTNQHVLIGTGIGCLSVGKLLLRTQRGFHVHNFLIFFFSRFMIIFSLNNYFFVTLWVPPFTRYAFFGSIHISHTYRVKVIHVVVNYIFVLCERWKQMNWIDLKK